MGVMKFVLTDELEEALRSKFRKKGDLSNIVEICLRKCLKVKAVKEEIEELEDIES